MLQIKGHLRTLRALQRHSRGTPRALGHSRQSSTRALEGLGYSKRTWGFQHSGNLSTWELGHSKSTWRLGQSRYSRHLGI